MDNIREEMIAQFRDLTQCDTRAIAEQYLTLSDFNIESAIQLFFESGGVDLAGPGGGASSGSRPAGQDIQERGGSERDAIQVDDDDDPNDGYQQIGEGSLEDWRNAATSEERQERLIRDAQRRNQGGAAGGSGSSASPAEAGASSSGAAGAGGSTTFDDDEAMARRLQEEAWADMGAAGAEMEGGFGNDGVRAPIAKTRETLVGPDDDYIRRMLDARNYRQSQRGSTTRPGIFNQRNVGSPSIWDEEEGQSSVATRSRLAESTGGRSELSSKSSQLAAMFRPPFEIMSNLSLDDARDMAREEEKWILVNIQDLEFPSQVLNRDLWKDEAIKQTIKGNFVFLQHQKDSPDGLDYIRLYMNNSMYSEFPHIAILDPRTGEQLKVWATVPDKAEFLMQLHEFLDRYSLKHDAKNPVQTVAKPKPVNVEAMTEDEMLQLALRNSLGNNESEPNGIDPDELTDKGKTNKKVEEDEDLMRFDDEPQKGGGGGGGSSSAAAPPAAAPAEPIELSPFDQIRSDAHHTEPAGGAPNVTRVQLRLSDGTRIVRRFELADPVRRIFEYVKADLLPEIAKKEGNVELDGGKGREFELRSLKQNLIEVLDSTIEEAGLKMGTVMVEFVED